MISPSAHNRRFSSSIAALIFFAAIAFFDSPCRAVNYEKSGVVPPAIPREFRGVWIATVANIDWPSKPGLSVADQKQELLAILDRAARIKLNAVIFQVRPACDAMYASPIEPWSEYLTGVMGRPPRPFYDPLAFAVEEAHRRGLELHAWFNPYRALHFSSKSPLAANHIARTHPELVKSYGKYLWLDPGEPAVRDYSLSVVMDVLRRYDIDGVHFDDYFYPDRVDAGVDSDFPDDASWSKFGAGGKFSREDWRRENVNLFIERVYQSVKAAKPWVKFGVSPHGIWRPRHPAQIRGMDAYAQIYADSRKWLDNGWLDYFAPQLYWPIKSKEQSFPALLDWWTEQNSEHRHLWPGLDVAKASQWLPDEIPNQIRLTRHQIGDSGYLLYNTTSLLHNNSLLAKLEQVINAQPALVPASPWLGNSRPDQPALLSRNGILLPPKISWMTASTVPVRFWAWQTRTGAEWRTEILPANVSFRVIQGVPPDVVAVTAVDRNGNSSAPAVLQINREPPGAKRRRTVH